METENETTVEETTQNDTDVEETTTEAEAEETTEESLEDRIARLEKENHTLKIQKGKIKAKAERAATVPDTPKVELTNLDILAIAKSDVHEEDLDRVTKFAQMEGISVKDALVHDDLQAILERRAEARKVAAASNTGNSKAGTAEVTGDTLLRDASAGKLPDPDKLTQMWDAATKR